jgi:hypothetical protein
LFLALFVRGFFARPALFGQEKKPPHEQFILTADGWYRGKAEGEGAEGLYVVSANGVSLRFLFDTDVRQDPQRSELQKWSEKLGKDEVPVGSFTHVGRIADGEASGRCAGPCVPEKRRRPARGHDGRGASRPAGPRRASG